MELEILGIGNAFSAVHYQTSFLIRAERTYLVDGPQALFRLLLERGVPRSTIDDVIVTHIHGDHVSGLETLLLWKRYFENKKVRLHTSEAVYAKLQSCFFTSFSQGFSRNLREIESRRFEDYIEFQELHDDRRNELEGDLAVEIRHNWHPTPTLGLKVSSRNRTVAISGDTCYRPTLLKELHSLGLLSDSRYRKLSGDWLWEADVIYHEADANPDGPHTFEGDLLALPHETRRKIRLVHIPDDFKAQGLPVAIEGEKLIISEDGEILLKM